MLRSYCSMNNIERSILVPLLELFCLLSGRSRGPIALGQEATEKAMNGKGLLEISSVFQNTFLLTSQLLLLGQS